VVVALLVQWSRSDRDGSRSDRDGDAYRVMLADLARRRP
jgi:hypothetical protein